MFIASKPTRNSNTNTWFSFVRISFCIIILVLLLLQHKNSTYTSFIQDPLWWVLVGFGADLIIFNLALQMRHADFRRAFSRRMTPSFFLFHEESDTQNPASTVLQEIEVKADSAEIDMTDIKNQVFSALEGPFRYTGVRTENHREEIEKAVNSLCCQTDLNKQAFSDCLQQLLQAAKQNWVDLAVFSLRERQIMKLLLQNISYREMSERLHVSTSTIKTHIYHIFKKLDISSREEAIHLIHERGWFCLGEHKP